MHDEKTGNPFSKEEQEQILSYLREIEVMLDEENGTYNAARVRRVRLFCEYKWYYPFREYLEQLKIQDLRKTDQ